MERSLNNRYEARRADRVAYVNSLAVAIFLFENDFMEFSENPAIIKPYFKIFAIHSRSLSWKKLFLS